MKRVAFRFLCAVLAVLTVTGTLFFSPVSAEGDGAETLTVGGVRGDVMYIIWWMNGCPEPSTSYNPYPDVSNSDYRLPAILWAVETGVLTSTIFAPDQKCNRAQVVTFLWRAAGSPDPSGSEMPFSDVGKSDYCYMAVLWCLEEPSVDALTSGARFYPETEVVSLYASRSDEGTAFSFADPAHEHDYIRYEYAATCTTGGYTSCFCRVCCDESIADETEPLGHDWTEWKSPRDSYSYSDEIWDYRTCRRCGEEESRRIFSSADGFSYFVWDGGAHISGYTGSKSDLSIPSKLGGYPVTAVEKSAFANKDFLTRVTVPKGVTEIGESAFLSCSSLTEVVLPESLLSIGDSAFSGCAFTEVSLPNGVKRIGDRAFSGCLSLVSATIPMSVEQIGFAAFICPLFENVTVDPGNGAYVSVDGVLYDKDLKKIVCCPECKTEITLPEGLTEICPYAFACCTLLTGIGIPESVTAIGEGAFMYCSSLDSVVIPDGVTSLPDKVLFNCLSLGTLTLPRSVTSVEEETFNLSPILDIYYGGTKTDWDALDVAYLPLETTVHFADHECEFSFKETVAPTCTAYGRTVYVCTVCGFERADMTPSLGGHDFGKDGKAEKCLRCGEKNPIYSPIWSLPVFSDVAENAYYAESVRWAVINGVTQGTGGDKFSPDAGCTRGQVVTFLWRAAGSPEPKRGNNPFSDVNDEDYFFKAVLWAVENGVTSGTSKTTFSPNATCTRGQIVTFLWRAAGSPAPKRSKNPFTDVKNDDYFARAVLWAAENGVTAGTSKTTFSPESTCTRAQVVTFLFRSVSR